MMGQLDWTLRQAFGGKCLIVVCSGAVEARTYTREIAERFRHDVLRVDRDLHRVTFKGNGYIRFVPYSQNPETLSGIMARVVYMPGTFKVAPYHMMDEWDRFQSVQEARLS